MKTVTETFENILKRLPVPAKSAELWQYTNLTPLLAHHWKDNQSLVAGEFLFEEKPEWRFVFVNGHYQEQLSSDHLPAELSVKRESSKNLPDAASFLVELNRAFQGSQLTLEIASDSKLDRPLHFYFFHQGDLSMGNPSIQIIAKKYSQCELIETSSSGEGLQFENSVMQIALQEGAKVVHLRRQIHGPQSYPFSSHYLQLDAHSSYQSFLLLQGGQLGRHTMQVNLNQDEAKAELLGLYALREEQQSDLYLQVNHRSAHTYSDQYYKGLFDDQSHGVFHGKVVVEPNAQQIAATQLNRNLLLSRKAHIDTQPQLEIHADDVKCSHGATIGQLSAEELFYLQSRGISKEKAQILLAFGFAFDVISKVPVHLHDLLLIPFRKQFASLHLPGR